MAARRRGFTPGPWWLSWGWGKGVFAPVASGVEKLEGSSEVKIVALEGEMRYFAVSVAMRASLKPVHHHRISTLT